jgi:hypothetical protein
MEAVRACLSLCASAQVRVRCAASRFELPRAICPSMLHTHLSCKESQHVICSRKVICPCLVIAPIGVQAERGFRRAADPYPACRVRPVGWRSGLFRPSAAINFQPAFEDARRRHTCLCNDATTARRCAIAQAAATGVHHGVSLTVVNGHGSWNAGKPLEIVLVASDGREPCPTGFRGLRR